MRFNLKEFRPLVGYISMGAYFESYLPTYSGGLEVFTGDIFRSCADMGVPLVGIIQASSNGYFSQKIDKNGWQHEEPVHWSPRDTLPRLETTVNIKHKGHDLVVGAEVYLVRGETGYAIPVFLLDTDFEKNNTEDRSITGMLYDPNIERRIAQENVLGQAGVKLVGEVGYDSIKTYAINEGHAAFTTLALLKQKNGSHNDVKNLCTFTTHTPIAYAHEEWDYSKVEQIVGDLLPKDVRLLAGEDKLSMTRLAFNLSRYTNAVSEKHAKVCDSMNIFKISNAQQKTNYITNGIHLKTWVVAPFAKLYDDHLQHWKLQPRVFDSVLDRIPPDEILEAKATAKRYLIGFINATNPVKFNPNDITIVWARRFSEYKRPLLLFRDTDRLHRLADRYGPIQIIYSGKAHPNDNGGKELIQKVIQSSKKLGNKVKLVFIEGYDTKIAKRLLGGADVWLNTPRRPLEASGTSGIKAAVNGCLNLTVWDGWVPEGYALNPEGMFIIGPKNSEQIKENTNHDEEDKEDAKGLYDELEKILQIYYKTKYIENDELARRTGHSIRLASHSNSHRVVREYAPVWGIEL